MKLAIVGSRNFNDYKKFKKHILEVVCLWELDLSDLTIISGGAKGADSLAGEFATDFDIPIKIYSANWKKYGKAAGVLRNSQIINEATHVVAFPSVTGKGTQDSIKKAKEREIPCEYFYID